MPSFLSTYRPQLAFFGKMLAAYIIWYLLYDLWLLPDGRLDARLSHIVAAQSAEVLRLFGFDALAGQRLVWITGAAGLSVVNGCNGLSTIGLFVGFVLAFPGSMRRRALFLPLGALTIYAANVGRVAVLSVMQVHWPEGFAAVHDLGAPTFFYTVVFLLWVIWANIGTPSPSQAASVPAVSPAPSA